MSISKQVFRSGIYKDYFAQGVKTGKTLHLAGQVGIDAEGKIPASIADQTILTYQHIQRVLSEFGATMENIVDETIFVTDMSETMKNVEDIFSVRAQAYGAVPEVSQTLVQVVALISPKLKIEIKCIAHF
ncbi:MAG: RidA family protein [Kangiellaceae bacterium]|nr:RidA family protein [Kangiellaceae bacterium]